MERKLPKLRGLYRFNSPVSHFTWFKTGGKAEILYKPADEEDLAEFLKNLSVEMPVTVIGAGSNMLIRDKGVLGVLLKLGNPFQKINVNNNLLSIGTSTLNFNVANFCLQHQITGLEFLVGIPGSIGGGIAMNAGAYGSEFKDVLHSVEALDRAGKKHIFSVNELNFQYRKCGLVGNFIFTKANFHYRHDDKDRIYNRMSEITQSRKSTQPITERTGGSTFKNPTGHKVWKLIDECGLRGYSIGGAVISKLHCNFLINTGTATSKDLEQLGILMHESVLKKFNIDLEWELRIIGEK